jgi:hypothetical protein
VSLPAPRAVPVGLAVTGEEESRCDHVT